MVVSIIITLLLVLFVWGLLLTFVGNSVQQFIANSSTYQERLQAIVGQLFDLLQILGIDTSFQYWREYLDPAAIFPLASSMLNSVGNVLADTFMILLFVVFILSENVGLYERLMHMFPDSHGRFENLLSIRSKVNKYMAIKAAVSLGTGVIIWLGLLLIDVDYPLLWGLLAFALNFIPTLGSLIAAVPPVLLALVQLGPVHSLFTAGLVFYH